MVLENELRKSQKNEESRSINSPLLLHEPGSTLIKSREEVLKRQNDFK
jgi:hypothetical protein